VNRRLLTGPLTAIDNSSFAPLQYGELLESVGDNVEISPKRGGWLIKVARVSKIFLCMRDNLG
jgi:hypothetical protein